MLAVVVVIVGWPLRAQRLATRRAPSPPRTELAELEAERDAKYREIRDAELDHRTGKLSDQDFQTIDGSLRAEAVEILRQLDRIREQTWTN